MHTRSTAQPSSPAGIPSGPLALYATGLVLLAAAATFALYRETLDYGFHYDDYVLVRPHSLDEVLASFRGSWDTTGVMVPFYRPVTVAFHALRFEAFGLDARLHHALSLALFAACAALAGWLSFRVTGRLLAGAAGTLLFAAHPAMPYSVAAWVTNQMHLIATLTVLVALAWWHAARCRPFVWWVPLLVLGAIAFLIKEDGAMLLPCIVLVHGILRRVGEPRLQPVPRGFIIAAVALVAGLLVARTLALEGVGGYGRPTLGRAWFNYWGGLQKLLRLVPADRPWQPAASGFATLLPVAALFAWRRSSPGSRACMTMGFGMALVFNLPFALVTKAEQMHLVATGAVLMLTGAASVLFDAVHRSWARTIVVATIGAGVLASAAVARHITTDFDPFGPLVLARDDIVREWTAVPAQIHEYLARKRAAGRGHISPNPIDELPYVVFGAHGLETSPDGIRYQWMARRRADIFVFREARRIAIPLRHEVGAFREPAAAVVELEGRTVDRIRFETGAWRQSTFALAGTEPPYAVRVSIERLWYPARIIPNSNDPRALGLQIGEVVLR